MFDTWKHYHHKQQHASSVLQMKITRTKRKFCWCSIKQSFWLVIYTYAYFVLFTNRKYNKKTEDEHQQRRRHNDMYIHKKYVYVKSTWDTLKILANLQNKSITAIKNNAIKQCFQLLTTKKFLLEETLSLFVCVYLPYIIYLEISRCAFPCFLLTHIIHELLSEHYSQSLCTRRRTNNNSNINSNPRKSYTHV